MFSLPGNCIAVPVLLLTLAATGFVSAQALVTAQRGAEITPFVQSIYVQPDYGPYTDSGFTAGIDYSPLTRLFLQPSLEFRITHATGTAIAETSYSGGLKLAPNGFRIRPYADLLIGTGHVTFQHPSNSYEADSATVYTAGGGIEMDLPAQFRLRADFAQQFWSCDPAHPHSNDPRHRSLLPHPSPPRGHGIGHAPSTLSHSDSARLKGRES